MSEKTNKAIFKLKTEDKLISDDIGEYLEHLLVKLLCEQEGFSGKRPFGNSGWMGDLETPLLRAGVVEGSLDEDGYINDVDSDDANDKIINLIQDIFKNYRRGLKEK